MIAQKSRIYINHRNELVVDMSAEQMAKVFMKKNGRKPRSKQEASTFVQLLVTRRIMEIG